MLLQVVEPKDWVTHVQSLWEPLPLGSGLLTRGNSSSGSGSGSDISSNSCCHTSSGSANHSDTATAVNPMTLWSLVIDDIYEGKKNRRIVTGKS